MRIPVLLLVLLYVPSARAQDEPGLTERASKPTSYASPQHFWFEFKLGPYIPGIDGEFGGKATPYIDLFGYNDKGERTGDGRNIMFTWELEFEILRRFGTLAAGASLGYFSNSAVAFKDSAPDKSGVVTSPSPKDAVRSGSETSIKMLPLAALVVYRFDWLADRYRIPLVPYFKFGFNYTFWWMLLNGDTRKIEVLDANGKPVLDEKGNAKTVDGKGGTFGWQINAGMAFRLDILDPSAARALDQEIGINHTYLFFELAHVAANGMGAKKALGLGDTTWSGGLAFEF